MRKFFFVFILLFYFINANNLFALTCYGNDDAGYFMFEAEDINANQVCALPSFAIKYQNDIWYCPKLCAGKDIGCITNLLKNMNVEYFITNSGAKIPKNNVSNLLSCAFLEQPNCYGIQNPSEFKSILKICNYPTEAQNQQQNATNTQENIDTAPLLKVQYDPINEKTKTYILINASEEVIVNKNFNQNYISQNQNNTQDNTNNNNENNTPDFTNNLLDEILNWFSSVNNNQNNQQNNQTLNNNTNNPNNQQGFTVTDDILSDISINITKDQNTKSNINQQANNIHKSKEMDTENIKSTTIVKKIKNFSKKITNKIKNVFVNIFQKVKNSFIGMFTKIKQAIFEPILEAIGYQNKTKQHTAQQNTKTNQSNPSVNKEYTQNIIATQKPIKKENARQLNNTIKQKEQRKDNGSLIIIISIILIVAFILSYLAKFTFKK